jgi:hypothetical protein
VAGPDVVRPGDDGGVTLVQPMLPLWDEPVPDHTARAVATSENRVAWMRARAHGVTSTDAARLTGVSAVETVAVDKLLGKNFWGNEYTRHGRLREPVIGGWVQREHGIAPSSTLFHALGNRRHLATPDGLRVAATGVELLEIKTTNYAWRSIPKPYLRQVFWQQYVLGAERTLVVWEHHVDFVPVGEPRCRWVDRDENEIHALVHLADRVLDRMRR